MKNNPTFPLWASVFTVLGLYIGMQFAGPDQAISFSVGNNKNKLSEVLDYIDYYYVDPVEKEDLIEQTINELLTKLDPHSQYISAHDLQMYNEPLEGNFDGIGVQFRILEDTVTVIRPIQGGPSEKVGVLAGDQIITVNDSGIAGVGITNADIMGLLKGPRKTTVKIGVRRVHSDSLISFTVERDRIPIQSVDASYLLTEDIGYVKLVRFAKTTGYEVLDSIQSLKDKGMEKLVLDLRGNGGGILQASIQLAEAFLDRDKLVLYTEGKSQARRDYYTSKKGKYANMPLVVLMDEQSASASEILAGALQDNDRGTIVGRRSFGKGLVQEQVEFDDLSALRLTVARYYTPTGRSIQKPYGAGLDYDADIQNRFEAGEFYSADSIQFPDSLVFTTPAGDTVYGGGGIMPDVFIPLQLEQGEEGWYSKLFYSGNLNTLAFNIAKRERQKVWKEHDFIRNFTFTSSDFETIQHYLNLSTLPKNADSEMRLKAFVARSLFGENAFYQIWNSRDTAVNKSLDLLKN